MTDPATISTDGFNPLDGVRVVNGSYVFDGGAYDDSEAEGGEETRGRVHDAISRLYSDEKFHSHIVGLLHWMGRKKSLNSLEIPRDDEGFKAACDVVYRRLMDGPVGPWLDRLGDQALEDIIVCSAGFGPVLLAVAEETKGKRMARKQAAQSASEGGENVGS